VLSNLSSDSPEYFHVLLVLEDLQHAGIFAATYSGKTTLIASILTQLKIPWIAFDRKRDLRALCRKYNIKVLRWEWMKINPLQPPPVEFEPPFSSVCINDALRNLNRNCVCGSSGAGNRI
jgi:hypothetical protein